MLSRAAKEQVDPRVLEQEENLVAELGKAGHSEVATALQARPDFRVPPLCHSLLLANKIRQDAESLLAQKVGDMRHDAMLHSVIDEMRDKGSHLSVQCNMLLCGDPGAKAFQVGKCQNRDLLKLERNASNIDEIIRDDGDGVRKVLDTALSKVALEFDTQVTEHIVNLLNQPSQILGAGLEWTGLKSGMEVDGEINPGLMTRAHSRGVIAQILSLKYCTTNGSTACVSGGPGGGKSQSVEYLVQQYLLLEENANILFASQEDSNAQLLLRRKEKIYCWAVQGLIPGNLGANLTRNTNVYVVVSGSHRCLAT